MYFGWLHKKTPGNWSTNVLKKIYLGRFRFLDFLSTARNDRIFLFSRTLKNTYISINLCICFSYTREHLKIGVSTSSKKVFFGQFRVLEFFSTTRNDRIFLFSRALKKYYISLNLCILVGYIKNQQKIGVPMSSKKCICVGFVFSNFFRLL